MIQNISGPLINREMEVGDPLIHRLLYRLFVKLEFPVSGVLIYQWVSILSGIVLFSFLYSWARKEYKGAGSQLLFLLLFFSQGSVMLFFGHAESYSLLFAAVVVFFLTALRTTGGGSFVIPAITAGAAVFLHPAGAVLLPLLLFLWLLPRNRISLTKVRLLILAVTAGICIIAAALFFRSQGSELFLQFFPDTLHPYAVLSSGHLVDLLNMIGLLSPVSLILLCAYGPPKINNRQVFLLGSSLVLLISMGMIGINLEAADWDLFAFSLIPLFLLAFETANSRGLEEKAVKYSGIALAIIAFHTAPWVLSNTSVPITLRQYSAIAFRSSHYDRTNIYARGMVQAFSPPMNDYTGALKLGDDAVRSGMADSRIWNNMGWVYYKLDRIPEAIDAYRRVLLVDPGHFKAWFMLGTMHMDSARYDSSANSFRRASASRPNDLVSRQLWADGLLRSGALMQSAVVCDSALIHWPNDRLLLAIKMECRRRMIKPGSSISAAETFKSLK